MNTDLASYVAERRAALHLTQQELATRAGLKRDVIASIETRKSKLPVPETRRRLAVALGIRHVDILVAAGELSADEIDPRRQPTYGDNRLQIVADNWDQLDEEQKHHMLSIIELHRRRLGFDGLNDIVQVIAESVSGRRASG